MLFGFFGKRLLLKGARCTGMGFQRHGSEMSGEFVILLRYGRATGNRQGCGMQTGEVAEWNKSVSLHRVKTWPQLMHQENSIIS